MDKRYTRTQIHLHFLRSPSPPLSPSLPLPLLLRFSEWLAVTQPESRARTPAARGKNTVSVLGSI